MIKTMLVLKNSSCFLALISSLSLCYAADFTDPCESEEEYPTKIRRRESDVPTTTLTSLPKADVSLLDRGRSSTPAAGDDRKRKRDIKKEKEAEGIEVLMSLGEEVIQQQPATTNPLAELLLAATTIKDEPADNEAEYNVPEQQLPPISSPPPGEEFFQQAKPSQILDELLSRNKTYEDFREALENASLFDEKRAQIKLSLAYERIANKIEIIDDATAYHLLRQISQDQRLSPHTRAYADFYRGMMGTMKRAPELINDQTYQLLLQASQDQRLSTYSRAVADFYRGVMGVKRMAPELTDEQTYEILLQASEQKLLDNEKRAIANYYRAVMGLRGRTSKLTDAQTEEIFSQVSKDQSLPASKRARADYYKGVIEVQRKAARLTVAQIEELRSQVNEDQFSYALQRAHSGYFRGVMGADRMLGLTDDQAYELLLQASEQNLLDEEKRAIANYYRGVMGAERRTVELTDIHAYQILLQVSENVKFAKEIRLNALILKIKMKIDGRIEMNNEIRILNDEEDISSLTSFIVDSSMNRAQRIQASELLTALLKS